MTNSPGRQSDPVYLSFVIGHLSFVISSPGAGLEALELRALSVTWSKIRFQRLCRCRGIEARRGRVR